MNCLGKMKCAGAPGTREYFFGGDIRARQQFQEAGSGGSRLWQIFRIATISIFIQTCYAAEDYKLGIGLEQMLSWNTKICVVEVLKVSAIKDGADARGPDYATTYQDISVEVTKAMFNSTFAGDSSLSLRITYPPKISKVTFERLESVKPNENWILAYTERDCLWLMTYSDSNENAVRKIIGHFSGKEDWWKPASIEKLGDTEFVFGYLLALSKECKSAATDDPCNKNAHYQMLSILPRARTPGLVSSILTYLESYPMGDDFTKELNAVIVTSILNKTDAQLRDVFISELSNLTLRNSGKTKVLEGLSDSNKQSLKEILKGSPRWQAELKRFPSEGKLVEDALASK